MSAINNYQEAVQMSRKLITVLALTLVLTLGVAFTAMAQGNGPGTGLNGDCINGVFVDEDGDGVCDNATQPQDGTGSQYGRNNAANGAAMLGQNQTGGGLNFVDENGDGACDLFVDADGDGISDNRMGPQSQAGQGQGQSAMTRQHGRRGGQGQQGGFGQGMNR